MRLISSFTSGANGNGDFLSQLRAAFCGEAERKEEEEEEEEDKEELPDGSFLQPLISPSSRHSSDIPQLPHRVCTLVCDAMGARVQ